MLVAITGVCMSCDVARRALQPRVIDRVKDCIWAVHEVAIKQMSE